MTQSYYLRFINEVSEFQRVQCQSFVWLYLHDREGDFTSLANFGGGCYNWNLNLIFSNHTCQNSTFNMTEILPFEKRIISRNSSVLLQLPSL